MKAILGLMMTLTLLVSSHALANEPLVSCKNEPNNEWFYISNTVSDNGSTVEWRLQYKPSHSPIALEEVLRNVNLFSNNGHLMFSSTWDHSRLVLVDVYDGRSLVDVKVFLFSSGGPSTEFVCSL